MARFVVEEDGLVVCPKCGFHQAGGHTCGKCGIVFHKYKPRDPVVSAAKETRFPKRKERRLGLGEMKLAADFFRRAAQLLAAGLQLNEVFRTASKRGNRWGRLVSSAADHAHLGFVGALRAASVAFPAYVWALLDAGEQSGELVKVLYRLAEELEQTRKIIMRRIFNLRTLWFFGVILCAIFALSVGAGIRGLTPEHVDQGVGAIVTAVFIRGLFFFVGYSLLAVFLGVVFFWFQFEGKHALTDSLPGFEQFRLSVPLFSSVLIGETLIRHFHILNLCLESGLPLPRSLSLAAGAVEFPSWRKAFDRVRDDVEAGADLGQAYERVPRIPEELLAEIRVGVKTGTIGEGMHAQIRQLEEVVEHRKTVVSALMFGVLFLISMLIAVFVFIQVFGAWMPLYQEVLGV